MFVEKIRCPLKLYNPCYAPLKDHDKVLWLFLDHGNVIAFFFIPQSMNTSDVFWQALASVDHDSKNATSEDLLLLMFNNFWLFSKSVESCFWEPFRTWFLSRFWWSRGSYQSFWHSFSTSLFTVIIKILSCDPTH
jgi:hypothetical protein